MKRYIFIIFLAFFNLSIKSQTITVLDKTNLQPLQFVTVSCNNSKITVITNNNGMVNIDNFKNADSIYFNHVSYTGKAYSKKELEKCKFKVLMSEKSYSIDEIVVSASKFEEKRKDVAQPIEVIKTKELMFQSQPTTSEVMQNTGNVFVQKSQLGGGSPIIRGFETNKVLIVVDGIRMNNAIYRAGHVQNIITIDNSMLDKIEIVFGPGSVIYGSDALGGVMHFYSKTPTLSDTNKILIKTNAYTRYSTAMNEKTGHLDINLGWKKFASLTSFTMSDFGDLRQGANRNPFYADWGKCTFYTERINGKDSMITNNDVNIQKNSGYKQYDLMQKFLYKQSEHVSHAINLQYSTSSNIPRYDRLSLLSGASPKFAEWYYGPQKRLLTSYSLSIASNNKLFNNAKIIFGYQNIEESRYDRKFNKNSLNNRIEKLDIVTFNADFAKKIKRNELRYGAEITYNNVNSSAFVKDIVTLATDSLDTRYPDGGSKMQTIAVYLTDNYEINEKLIINTGIRYSNIMLKSVFQNKTFFPFPFDEVTQKSNAVNGNLGIVYMPCCDWRFTLMASRGFRAPNVDDLSKVFESVAGHVIVPNPNLEPEYTNNLDFSISKTINKQVTIGADAYYTWYNNAITTQKGTYNGLDSIMYEGELSEIFMNVNVAKAYLYGAGAFLNAQITENFSVTNTINYTFGRIKTDTTDYPLDHIAPVFGKTSFNLNIKKFSGEFSVLYNGAKLSRNYNLVGEDNASTSADPIKGYTPAWATLNIRSAYQLNKYLQLQFAIENILDENYRVFASGISSPGRNFIFTLRGKF